jgi:hypothetical protein
MPRIIHGEFVSPPPKPPNPSSATAPDEASSEGVFRLSVAQFLVALVLLIVTAPFIEERPNGILLESILLTLVLLSAVIAVGGRRRTFVLAVILVTPAVGSKWLEHFRPELVPHEFTLVTAMVFVAFVIARLFHFILHAPRVTNEVLCAAIATYLMLGILWSFGYVLVANCVPNAFAFTVPADTHREMVGFRSWYFSFSTLTTVGYGDIVPVANAARMLAMTESTTGMFFATVLIARLVALYSTNRPAGSGEE